MCIPSNLQCNVENAKNFHHVLLLTRTGSFCLINTILLHYCEFCSLSSTTKHQMVLVMFARNTCLWILWKRAFFHYFWYHFPSKLPLQKTLLLLQYANFFKEGLRKVPKNWKLESCCCHCHPICKQVFHTFKNKGILWCFSWQNVHFFLRLTISQNKQVFVARKK